MNKVLVIALTFFALSACKLSVRNTQLVDEWGNTYDNKATRAFEHSVIYTDNTTDVWGLEENNCKQFYRCDTVSYKGKSSIALVWDRTDKCEWVGFGNGWNGYVGKDLSDVMETGSIDFYIRSVNDIAYIPTLIFLLEDYSGVQTAAILKAKHLTNYPINTTWQKVSIPLKNFLMAGEPLSDFSNIKGLNIEFMGAGAIYIDEMSIGKAEFNADNNLKFGQTITKNYPVNIYSDQITYGWGLSNEKGKVITYDTSVYFAGKQSIRCNYNKTIAATTVNQLGFSWQKWQATSFNDSLNKLLLTFFINSVEPIDQLMSVGFESYNGKKVFTQIKQENITKTLQSNWQKVSIPLNQFNFTNQDFDTTRFKQLLIQLEKTGNFWIDEINIYNLNTND